MKTPLKNFPLLMSCKADAQRMFMSHVVL